MVFDYAKDFYKENEYPAAAWDIERWAKEKPFEGIKILDSSPVYRNTLIKHKALVVAGAELTVGISDVMPYDPFIINLLRENGVRVVNAADEPFEQDVILDCAGAFSEWPSRYGVSELTRSGAYIYADSQRPVFLADAGRIKRIETCLGTGDGFMRAMAQEGYAEWKGRRLVVFGSGKVGTGIIYRAVREGAVVDVVTDPETLSPFIGKMINKCVDFRDHSSVVQLLDGAYAVVTATGVKGAVTQCCDAATLLGCGALLANMGVEDEFGESVPETAAINGKRALNFILEDPTQMKYIDATMTLHNHGALFLLHGPHSGGIIAPDDKQEEAILEVTRRNGLIADELDLIYNI